ncbi:hypothetical protein [Melaminivora suipulveris]|uniref:hypothetical protein n=1 Tax=Melaminivora suipulveris TaxID=2109913 RepID=UPI00131A5973|nr:hypothetical protein [Melaminivora suipulveris]
MHKNIFEKIEYKNLNSRQKENFNFQKISGILADYGFVTIRLSDDWNGADLIARHIDGEIFLKIQLKGVLTLDSKYYGKDIWICFRGKDFWYLYPHDFFYAWAFENTNFTKTRGWEFNTDDQTPLKGMYTWPTPNKQIREWLESYILHEEKDH